MESGVPHICPMHPGVRSAGPGSCSLCGMALEPVIAETRSARDPELLSMQRRFWLSLPLALGVVALAMSVPEGGGRAGVRVWLQLGLSTPVVLFGAWPFFERAWASFVSRNLNMFSLIAIGIGAAYGYSLVAVLAPGIFPASHRSADGAVALYFESAAVITTLVLLGQVLELRARGRRCPPR